MLCCPYFRSFVVVLGLALIVGGVGWLVLPPSEPAVANGEPKVIAGEPKQAGGEAPKVGSEWPMFGGSPARNMANTVDKGILTDWKVEGGELKNVKWLARLGSRAWGLPVVADGKVFISTNNGKPRDKKIKGFKGVLMCFEEKTGNFLWQIVHKMPPDEVVTDMAQIDGLCSTPAVEGKKLWYISPACEVVCAGTDGKVLWTYDMMKELDVVPHYLAASSPLIVGERVFVVTGNGVPVNGQLDPKAASFAAIDKNTGKLLWKNALPGEGIIEGQWSNPVLAKVNGREQIIFPGGDCWLYSLDPADGKLIWKFHCNTKADVKEAAKGKDKVTNYIVATPVVYENRCYVGIGLYPENPSHTPWGHLWCIDVTKKGDLSPVDDNLDPKAPVNKNSGLVWHYGGPLMPRPEAGRKTDFGGTMSTAAIHDGLLFIAEDAGYLHCLDATTGKKHWEHDFRSGVLGSAYYVDGKVYVGTEDGDIVIFAAAKAKRVINTIYMDESLKSTPVVANGVLYIATMTKLYALAPEKAK